MNEDAILELSNYAGLTAAVVLTINFFLGMLLATAYKVNPYWKKLPQRIQQLDVNDIHNYTAYIAWVLVLLHVLFLVLDKTSKFTFTDVLFPLNASSQSLIIAFGTVSLYAITVVIITTQKVIKRKMSFRAWKNIHLISYGTAILFVLHGIFMDPHLNNDQPDFFDGEKLLLECCGLLLIVASVLRYRYHLKKERIG
ncbi:MAG TPA: ferric reductase-like transmembrane domain-containing protein [Chitinophagaceae bacterium]|jgi:DMSO/TMAO reductase YedYZ heme-binding membrane subunit|nr:ferric reductase-like transmembrane domain-containing protein [Chitinophagaceae bacterium]